jgi:hypothetical protein
MASTSNPFLGLDAATLGTLKSKTLDAIQAVLLNQSYSLNGKSVTRANLPDLNQMLGQLQAAIDFANGDTATNTFVSFTGV